MKLIAVLLSGILLLADQPAHSAPIISVKSVSTNFSFETNLDISRTILKQDLIITVGSFDGSADISARTFDGAIKWRLALKDGVIATDIKEGTDGTFWVLGGGESFETNTVVIPSGLINPDSITVIPRTPLSKGLTELRLWNISNSGKLLANISLSNQYPSFPKAFAFTEKGMVIVGSQITSKGSAGAIWMCSLTACELPQLTGVQSTALNDVTNFGSDVYCVGQSGETINKLPVKGVLDGILLRVEKTGKLKSVVRSSLPKIKRNWENVTNGYLQGGFAEGKTSEATVTQFSGTKFGTPVWSARFPAQSSATSAGNGALFLSSGPINGLKNWKPKLQLLLLTFTGKGSIKTGTTITTGGNPVWLSYLKGLGYGVISAQGNTMYFTLIRE